jgi:hypothetical protein
MRWLGKGHTDAAHLVSSGNRKIFDFAITPLFSASTRAEIVAVYTINYVFTLFLLSWNIGK